MAARQARRHRRRRETIDAAGNQWFTLAGESERAVLIGGHIDSVPNGGWLDGALNVVAGVEVLRRIAEDGTPPVTIRLVNWADEEGARFGRSLFGSSAAAGSMADQDELRQLTDSRRGRACRTRSPSTASTSTAPSRPGASSSTAAAYLELHIEQGPVLESLGLPLGVVLGTFGVERHRITWRGQAAHAGLDADGRATGRARGSGEARPRDPRDRRGAPAAAPSARRADVVCRPGIVTSVVETAEQLLDQRDLDADRLAAMLAEAKAASERFAAEERIEVEWERIWSIEPILFDDTLLGFCEEAVAEVAGRRTACPRARCTTPPRSPGRASRR